MSIEISHRIFILLVYIVTAVDPNGYVYFHITHKYEQRKQTIEVIDNSRNTSTQGPILINKFKKSSSSEKNCISMKSIH